jgi:hypothetical protein
MITMDEHQALEHIQSRLAARFPAVPAETVRLTVTSVHARFDGRVRNYVPILVEREAKERLAALAAQAPQLTDADRESDSREQPAAPGQRSVSSQ